MKKATLIVTTFLLVAGLTVNGQTEHEHGQQSKEQQSTTMQQGDMMQGGMTQGMMQQDMPMQKYMMMVNRLPLMQKQLSLSQEQAEKLIDLQADFQKQQARHQESMAGNNEKLQTLLDNMASAAEIKKQMQQCANSRIDMGIAAYETAGKMKAVLTADQKEKMKDMMMQQGQSGMMQDGMMQN